MLDTFIYCFVGSFVGTMVGFMALIVIGEELSKYMYGLWFDIGVGIAFGLTMYMAIMSVITLIIGVIE